MGTLFLSNLYTISNIYKKFVEKCFQSICPKECVKNLKYVKGFFNDDLYEENNKSFDFPFVIYFKISAIKDIKKNVNINIELY